MKNISQICRGVDSRILSHNSDAGSVEIFTNDDFILVDNLSKSAEPLNKPRVVIQIGGGLYEFNSFKDLEAQLIK